MSGFAVGSVMRHFFMKIQTTPPLPSPEDWVVVTTTAVVVALVIAVHGGHWPAAWQSRLHVKHGQAMLVRLNKALDSVMPRFRTN